MAKRVAVIGAGASGLTATKACLEEGLEPVTFERTLAIGGLWNFTEEVREDLACVMRSTVINTSKEMMCFSDFPIPKEFPNMMHNRYVLKYLNLYMDRFDLERHIRYNHEIRYITQAPDYDLTGQWAVTYIDHSSGENPPEVTERFDGVLLCTGHHASKHVPTFPGQEKFEGKMVHTHDYKDARGLEDKNVVVIGVGNSGVDVCAELSKIAKQTYMVTRSGVWLMKKSGKGNMPWDVLGLRRWRMTLVNILGPKLMTEIAEKEANQIIDHKAFGLQPNHGFFGQHGTANDDIPYAVLSGLVIVKPNVKEIKQKSVVFVDGTEVEADAIILATGYKFGFNYLDKQVIDVKNNKVSLYKYMFPPELSRGTLAVIGCVQPIGALFPISEIQSRWAVRIIKGIQKLPSREIMQKDIDTKALMMRLRYHESPRHTIQVDWIPFMDEIAECLGVKPHIGKLLRWDPRLAYHLYFGPCTPVQYRLEGPNPWSGAREAILTTMNRVREPFKTRTPNSTKPDGFWTLDRIALALFLVVLLVFNIILISCLWLWL